MAAAVFALPLLGTALRPMHAQQPVVEATQIFALSSNISIELPASWHAVESDEIPTPGALAPYAPPFHFSQVATFTNEQQKAILLLGLSDNPLLGHDSYWLDAQMHAPSGSGMSVLDLLFYFFFPPSQVCMENALQNYTDAAITPSSEDAPPRLQVTYACPHSPTLTGFYSAQVSSGVTFEQTNSGPKAYGVIRDFYLSPMEQADISGLTFYSFEAQRQGQISKAAVGHYNLPENLQGSHSDFFWAIGAQSPFPFVADGRSIPLFHVGFATSAAATNNGREFSRLLHGIRTK
ncbi:MAG: hypothetical protein WCD49_17390 [Candidatus Acidiferrales bacterium]